MSIYSIKDLEHLSGIKAHTIRIWEQRHNLFSPQRTDTNIRFYDDDDLKLILNISLLKNHGVKISKIVQMTPEHLREEVTRLNQSEYVNEDQINALTVAMLDMNEELFTSVIATNQKQIGLEKTMSNIIYPFFKKIGILWMANSINPAQEHFISNLVRQKLILETAGLYPPSKEERFLLFLPEGEMHEISLLFANYFLRSKGYKTYYLGQSVPIRDLEEVYHQLNPEHLFTVITSSPTNSKLQLFIQDLGKKFEKSTILITGAQVLKSDVPLPDNVLRITHFDELETIIEDLMHI